MQQEVKLPPPSISGVPETGFAALMRRMKRHGCQVMSPLFPQRRTILDGKIFITSLFE